MSESTNNPLNDFLNQAEEESENSLFAPIPFPDQPEPAGAVEPPGHSAENGSFARRRRRPVSEEAADKSFAGLWKGRKR